MNGLRLTFVYMFTDEIWRISKTWINLSKKEFCQKDKVEYMKKWNDIFDFGACQSLNQTCQNLYLKYFW